MSKGKSWVLWREEQWSPFSSSAVSCCQSTLPQLIDASPVLPTFSLVFYLYLYLFPLALYYSLSHSPLHPSLPSSASLSPLTLHLSLFPLSLSRSCSLYLSPLSLSTTLSLPQSLAPHSLSRYPSISLPTLFACQSLSPSERLWLSIHHTRRLFTLTDHDYPIIAPREETVRPKTLENFLALHSTSITVLLSLPVTSLCHKHPFPIRRRPRR